MALKLYNTMGRKVEEFKSIRDGYVGFYGCGPTVYNYAHIGNLRAYVFLDTLDRTLTFLGYDKKHVMNITDVGHLTGDSDDGDDKMVKTAEEKHQSVMEIAQFYTDAFFRDIDRLNIIRPDVVCKATDHIQEMIDLIKKIEANGHTYMAGGNLYFDVSTYKNYGDLANLNLDELKEGAGRRKEVVIDENKKNPQDFVLWFTKSKFENQALTWDSPWGRGYPGWHIECSCISLKYLGEELDIHCGGVDNIFPHHTNEIAQTESYIGKKWCNYWFHVEHLNDKSGKMSKSNGEFLTIDLLIKKGFNPLAYRLFCLQSNYQKQLLFTYDSLQGAQNTYEKLINRIKTINEDDSEIDKTEFDKYDNKFKETLCDNLNTSNSLTVLYDVLKSNINNNTKLELIKSFDKVLSLDLMKEEKHDEELIAYIEDMISKRKVAKKEGNYELADSIRNELLEKGIILKDTREGTVYEIK